MQGKALVVSPFVAYTRSRWPPERTGVHEDSEHRAKRPCARQSDLENVSLCILPYLPACEFQKEVFKVGGAVQGAKLRIVRQRSQQAL
jgi:hypothetical protein